MRHSPSMARKPWQRPWSGADLAGTCSVVWTRRQEAWLEWGLAMAGRPTLLRPQPTSSSWKPRAEGSPSLVGAKCSNTWVKKHLTLEPWNNPKTWHCKLVHIFFYVPLNDIQDWRGGSVLKSSVFLPRSQARPPEPLCQLTYPPSASSPQFRALMWYGGIHENKKAKT